MNCEWCNEKIKEPVSIIVEKNIVRDGIEMDVELEIIFCSEDCKQEYING